MQSHVKNDNVLQLLTKRSLAGPVSLRNQDEFVCRSPGIVSITPSLVINESSRVMLSCLADGDPAPAVVWRSPTDEFIGISAASDRKQTRTEAFWQVV